MQSRAMTLLFYGIVLILSYLAIVEATILLTNDITNKSLIRSSFPDDFIFGTASSAYQYEGAVNDGGRGPSIWDTFSHNYPGKIKDKSNGDIADDGYHLYKEDIEIMKDINMDAYRFSISWSRILPIAEGLGAIMRQAVVLNRFVPFKVGRGEMPVSHLQYADDTVFIGEATVDNLWAMKAILRGFEAVSSLKVNFWKSCLVGVNVEEDFLAMASRFLNCRIGRAPFKYLGLPMPVKVWKEVVKIQRKFLWGGVRSGSKMCWVKWEVVSKPKSEGGLGVRDLRKVNISLLAKWRWRLLFNEGEIWKLILEAKYGNNIIGSFVSAEVGGVRDASLWWKAITRIDGETRWFTDSLRKKVGNGVTTQFWSDVWVGSRPLKEVFPRPFCVSASKDLLVSDAGSWVISGVSLKSCYNFLSRSDSSNLLLSDVECFVFKNIWKSLAPSKVCGFAWQAILDRIPSRFNLSRRGVIKPPESKDCAFCRLVEEKSQHLLLQCDFASGVWYAIFNWLGFVYISPPNLLISFAAMSGLGVSKRRKKGLMLLWQVVLWSIWKARNDRLFNNKEASVNEVVDSIKHISWKWYLEGKLGGGVNKEGIKYYNNVINELLDKGLQPFITLFHWDLPRTLEEEYGGFLSPNIVNDFRDYAELCFKEFGDRVKHWITLNEPWSFAVHAYAEGTFAPGRCSPWQNLNCTGGDSATEPYIVAHNQLLAHASAVNIYKTKYQPSQKGKIGITLVCHWMIPLHDTKLDHDATQRYIDFQFGWFMDPLTIGDYPSSMRSLVGSRLPKFTTYQVKLIKGSFDFIGLNYYTTNYTTNAPESSEAKPSYITDSLVIVTNERNGIPIGPTASSTWLSIYPKGIYDLLLYTKIKYNNPLIYITENGMDEFDDPTLPLEEALEDTQRIDYHYDHLYYLQNAIQDGANVKGYFAWSSIDNFEWVLGYTSRSMLFSDSCSSGFALFGPV
ncbi:cyanogenic beta-glucosidase [Trifolium repens]|nr:cyanogenic beta-glucosidase [Trifolium repens]